MVTMNAALADKLNDLSKTLLSGHYIFNREITDEYLEKRFSQPEAFAHNISYAISTNPAELEQYYKIREEAYKEVLHVANFPTGADEIDAYSHILIVKNGSRVVGGARLTISSPQNPHMIPLEEDGFDVKSHFPELDFTKISYCEMTRLALLPEFRNHEISEEMHRIFLNICFENNVEIVFGRTTALQQRRTRVITRNLGYEMIIRKDIKLSHCEVNKHLNMQFACGDISKDKRFEHILRKAEAQSDAKESAENVEFA